jgi:hypothetical protein
MERGANAERPRVGSENRNRGGTEADGKRSHRSAHAVSAGNPKTVPAPRVCVAASRELRPLARSMKRGKDGAITAASREGFDGVKRRGSARFRRFPVLPRKALFCPYRFTATPLNQP